MILYNDCIYESGLFNSRAQTVFKAIDAGVNAWVNMRCPSRGSLQSQPSLLGITPFPSDYSRYFGVAQQVFSGWFCHAFGECDRRRIEDFIGAYSMDARVWPTLDVDSATLHSFYGWYAPWIGDSGIYGLPEVNWSKRVFGTEVMYLYRSLYSLPEYGGDGEHPLGYQYTFEESPVAHRFDRGLFRTVHFNFTLPSINPEQARAISTNVLDWLYDPWLTAPVSGLRYPDGPPEARLTIEEARQHYWLRNEMLSTEEAIPPYDQDGY
jgi:hypothetical protein